MECHQRSTHIHHAMCFYTLMRPLIFCAYFACNYSWVHLEMVMLLSMCLIVQVDMLADSIVCRR